MAPSRLVFTSGDNQREHSAREPQGSQSKRHLTSPGFWGPSHQNFPSQISALDCADYSFNHKLECTRSKLYFVSKTKIIFCFEALTFWVAETKFLSLGWCPILGDFGSLEDQGKGLLGCYLGMLVFRDTTVQISGRGLHISLLCLFLSRQQSQACVSHSGAYVPALPYFHKKNMTGQQQEGEGNNNVLLPEPTPMSINLLVINRNFPGVSVTNQAKTKQFNVENKFPLSIFSYP